MMVIAATKEPILRKLGSLDGAWGSMRRRHEDLWPLQVTGFKKAIEVFPEYLVLSAQQTYWAQEGQAEKRFVTTAKSVGFGEYPGERERLAFVKGAKDKTLEGALILNIPDNFLMTYSKKTPSSYTYDVKGNFSEAEKKDVLERYFLARKEIIGDINDSLKKYIGHEDPRTVRGNLCNYWEKRITLPVSDNGMLNQNLWRLLGAMDSAFLRRTDVIFGKNKIGFGEWQDCSHSEAPGYSLHYSITDEQDKFPLSTYGDSHTAQHVLFSVQQNLGMKLLPASAKLEELDSIK